MCVHVPLTRTRTLHLLTLTLKLKRLAFVFVPAVCEDTDGGASGAGGVNCDDIVSYPDICDGIYDVQSGDASWLSIDDDFKAGDMCCICGGGANGK